MTALKITQSRSLIGSSGRQRQTIKALGLRRMHHSVTRSDTPVIRGMLRVVSHLVEVEEVIDQEQETESNE
ncbi:MAG: 50S ribosomal protein L30 [Bacteroidetes bacterium]|nr:50S ribosomal protein L30 [Bacteroidota bacterium]MCY4204949.1 50S ribosomal protein L30 [Bacteroidota bacterium]